MTFSILAVDATGAIGSAISSSSPAVAARCVHLADGVGGANSQNITDPRLGTRLLRLLSERYDAGAALAAVVNSEPNIAYRQLLVMDANGRAAAYSGPHVLGVSGARRGNTSIAAGNLLSRPDLPQIMVDAYEQSEGEMEYRLLAALNAAVEAGGEAGPIHSAGLSVVRHAGWRVTDLRVDWHDNPISELGNLLDVWMPQRDAYVARGHDPSNAPTYGVAGDE